MDILTRSSNQFIKYLVCKYLIDCRGVQGNYNEIHYFNTRPILENKNESESKACLTLY